MDVNIPKVLTSEETRLALRISRKTLHRWSQAGRLGRLVGRRWKYTEDEIAKLLKLKSE